MMITGIAIGLAAAVLLGVVLTRAVTGPVAQGVTFAEALSGGDLTRITSYNVCYTKLLRAGLILATRAASSDARATAASPPSPA